jgi:uncharacterized membrane protein (UPF0182 family)
MPDLFDEIRDELRRRQAAARGQPDPTRRDGEDGPGGDDRGDDGRDDRPDDGSPRRSGGEPPRRVRRTRSGRAFGFRRFGLALIVLAVFVLLILGGFILDFWTDAIWYTSVGYDSVFWTRVGTQAALFFLTLVVVLGILLGNLWLAGRLSPPPDPTKPNPIAAFFERLAEGPGAGDRYDDGGLLGGFRTDPFGRPVRSRRAGPPIAFDAGDIPNLTPLARLAIALVAVLLALGTAGAVAGRWETIQLWLHQVPFSPAGEGAVTDPVFQRDIGFFLFQLPVLRLFQSIANGLIFAALLVAGVRYLVALAAGGAFSTAMRVHLAVLVGLFLLSVAGGYQLDKLELVYGDRGQVFTGVAYTDQHAQFLALDVLTIIAGLAAALLVGGAFTRWTWPLAVVLIGWFSASIVLGSLYPEAVQRFSVVPNQLAQESPYIANNIAMTRLAYGLDKWQGIDYRGEGTLTQDQINNEQATFQNARLWDYRPLGATLDQIQTIRQYYDFTDVDTDRYDISNQLRQVMLSARELVQDKASSPGQWVNQRITFTHGIGIAMVPVNEATPEGQPNLFISNLPPVSAPGAPTVTQPRIYFGERPSDYVITGARQPEFDYPVGGTDTAGSASSTTTWTGTTGIRLDTTLARLLFALRFRDLDMFISDQVTSSSQLLFHRSLGDRLPRIAPFLRYDKDPYVVVTSDGRLVYIQDAYTVSDRFPNANDFDVSQLGDGSGLARTNINYIRNSVKVVVDAYDGRTTFYAADPSDPILRAYEGVFPALFKPLDQMPADIRSHLRTPEELFNVQTRVYGAYHVQDPSIFFQGSDRWEVPTIQRKQEGQLAEEAYYVVMRMPGEGSPEFLLLQPMVPSGRQNMISWVAARNDDPNRGQVRVYQFPRDTTIFGPGQIQARIDQDSTISAQVTLWNQSGSTVIFGNLIVVPVQDALVYLEPIYLQSTGAKFPEFKKIVLASPTRVVWGDTLAEALRLLLSGAPLPSPSPGGSPGASPSPTPTTAPSATPGATPPSGDVAALIEYANLHFNRAQEALRNGDFATYGQEIKLVQDALRQLGTLVRSPAPSGASPNP